MFLRHLLSASSVAALRPWSRRTIPRHRTAGIEPPLNSGLDAGFALVDRADETFEPRLHEGLAHRLVFVVGSGVLYKQLIQQAGYRPHWPYGNLLRDACLHKDDNDADRCGAAAEFKNVQHTYPVRQAVSAGQLVDRSTTPTPSPQANVGALPVGRHRFFVERLLIVVGFTAAVLMLWWLRDLLIIVFGALVMAVVLQAIAEPISRYVGLGRGTALLAAISVLILTASFLGFFFGNQIGVQFADVARSVPEGWHDLRRLLEQHKLGRELVAAIGSGALSDATIVGRLKDLFLTLGNVLLDFILIFVGAVFFASQPRLYRNGFLKLFPGDWRKPIGTAVEDSGRALRLWLRGQLISIVIVGLLTWFGLVLAGVPAALALGIVAACLEIIPYLGPILSAIPGLLLAIVVGPETALWALAVYVAVQQIEGNVIQPLVQRKVVTLPPAVTLFGMVAAGLMFGFLGIVFAAPGAVVAYVLLKCLYVRELLHTPTSVPGELVQRKQGV